MPKTGLKGRYDFSLEYERGRRGSDLDGGRRSTLYLLPYGGKQNMIWSSHHLGSSSVTDFFGFATRQEFPFEKEGKNFQDP
jgi:hypothetical protein